MYTGPPKTYLGESSFNTAAKAVEAPRQILIHGGTGMNNRVNRRNFLKGSVALAMPGFAQSAADAAQRQTAKPAKRRLV